MKKIIFLTASCVSMCGYGQTKLHTDTKTLIAGTGIAHFVSQDNRDFGFATYNSGNLDGAFYLIDTTGDMAIKGNLRYDLSCTNRYPGVHVDFLSETGDTLFLVFDSTNAREMISYISAPIIKMYADSTSEIVSGNHPDLQVGFGDPAVVPVGIWQRINLKRNYTFTQMEFDDCGSALLITYFHPNGAILHESRFSPKLNRKKYWMP